MPRVRITERDPRLKHQISLYFKHGDLKITRVYCNCRLEPLGEVPNHGDPWAIYNNPDNHVGEFNPTAHTWKVFDA